jgi:uncharacterized DUF497 family protein
MNFDLFDWDDANILHLARHDITPEEAEQVLQNNPVDISAQHVHDEWRLTQAGETDTGRILTLITTERSSKLRVVSGWDAPRSDKNVYLTHRVTQTWNPS